MPFHPSMTAILNICLLAGGGLLLTAVPSPAQTTCDMGATDFNDCMARRCTELQGRGRLCGGYGVPPSGIQTDSSLTSPTISNYSRYGSTSTYYSTRYYGGYVPLDPNGNVLVRPSYVAPYRYVQPSQTIIIQSAPRPLPPLNRGGPTGVCYMGLC